MRVQTTIGAKRRRALITAGVAAFAVAASSLALTSRSVSRVAEHARELVAHATKQTASEPPRIELAQSAWSVGIQRTYDLDFGSVSRTTSDADHDGIVGTGKLRLAAQHMDDRGVTLQGSFAELAFISGDNEGSDESPPTNIERLRASLARPFLVFITSSGAVESISVDPVLDDSAFAFVRGFIATLQFIEPSGQNPSWTRWTTLETDNFGVCAARYERVGTEQFKKTKSDYRFLQMLAQLASQDGTPPPDKPRIQSETVIDRAQGIARRVAMNESVSVVVGDETLESRTHLTLQLSDTRRVELTPFNPSGWQRESLYAARGQSPDDELQSKRHVLGNASFSDLIAALVASPQTEESKSQRLDVVDRLVALFQLYPESIKDALKAIHDQLGRRDAELLLAAIANAKTAQSQTALGELASEAKLPKELRQGALMRLALHENPTESTLDVLRGVAQSSDDVTTRETALLALGGSARRAASSAATSDAAKDVVRELERRAQSATSIEQKTLLLSALGNTGSPDVLATVRRALADADPAVRAAGVNALRLVPGSEVDELIASLIARDPAPRVRRNAVDVVGVRSLTISLLRALSTSLETDLEAIVRLGVIGVLAGHVGLLPEVRALLLRAATNDVDAEVRRAADRAVNQKLASRQ